MTEPITPKEPVAVIDIGSSAIRMVIAEVGPKFDIRYLENLHKPVRFGKDVFNTGRMSNPVMWEGINILKDYKSIVDHYGIKRIITIATSAVREAANRDTFLDQVFVRTSLDVEVIESAEENRLDLLTVEYALKDKIDLDKKNCLIIEVGTGHAEIIILHKGEVKFTRALPIGSLRLPENAVFDKTDTSSLQRILKRSIKAISQEASKEYNLKELDTFIALGGDMRLVSRQLIEKTENNFAILQVKDFLDFIKSLSKTTVEELVNKYTISYEEAEMLYPALLIYSNFLSETNAQDIIVPSLSIRDGLLLEVSQMLSGYKRSDLAKQVINSVKNLGRKYQYDEAHASCVANLALKLYDFLKEDHGLGHRSRLLLEAASFLHDIGTYISVTSHHKHGAYLIEASEIFGLRKTDKDIIANVVRYHRRSVPKPTHVAYMSLPRNDRAIVSKLAAILRVADALDRSDQQKIRDFQIEKNKQTYNVWVSEEIGDISAEREALSEKGTMFADVFGASIHLNQGIPPKKNTP